MISIAFMKRQAGNRHGGLGGRLARAGGFPFRIVHPPRRDLDKRIAGYTRPGDLVITGCGQLEDHAGIARAVPGSRGSGLATEAVR